MYSVDTIVDMNFSRIWNCNAGTAIYNNNGTVLAENNWWGRNEDPSSYIGGFGGDADPWLMLGITAQPSSITTTGTSLIKANLNYNSDGVDTSGSGSISDGISVEFSASSGTLSHSYGVISSGSGKTVFTPSGGGTTTISATIDGETVSIPVKISDSTSSFGGGSNKNTGVGTAQNMKPGDEARFSFEGKGAVDGLSVTASGNIEKMMVTVKKENSLPSSIDPPGDPVYEYEDVTLYYTENSDLSGGEFSFGVPGGWLESKGYGTGDIVMLHYNEEAEEWEELETVFAGEKNGYYYYTARTPSFSWFAITASEGATVVPKETQAAVVTQAATEISTPVSSVATSLTTSAVTSAPTSPAVVSGSLESGEGASLWISLVVPALLVVLVVIVVAGIAGRRKKEYPEWWEDGKKR